MNRSEYHTRPLHVCYVCNELPPAPAGGIGPAVLATGKALARLGHEVTVVGVYDRAHEWEHPGISVRPVVRDPPGRSLQSKARTFLSDRLCLRRRIASVNAEGDGLDLVEWPDFAGNFLWSIPGIVDVVRTHGPWLSHRFLGLADRRPHVELLEWWTLNRVPNWSGVSSWILEHLEEVTGGSPRRRRVIYNPIDCSLFRPDADGPTETLVLFAGSLIERKGVYSVARAVPRVVEAVPDARFLFVGRDISGDATERIHRAAGMASEHVEVRRPLPQQELAALMRTAAVFAMPSRQETFGNVWAEAMASGVPVVGTVRTCGPEIVPHGVAGLLTDPDEPQSVAEAIVQLLQKRDLRRKMGVEGRRLAVSRYSVDLVASETAEFYLECISDTDRISS